MLKSLVVAILFFMFFGVVFSQEISRLQEIKKGEELNEYIIKTTIKGLEKVDIARVTYNIEEVHTYKKTLAHELFSNREKEAIKFYAMEIPATGIVIVEFSLTLADQGEYLFPVSFQYSHNDEKKVIQFPPLIFSEKTILAMKNRAKALKYERSIASLPVVYKNHVKVVEKKKEDPVKEKEQTIKEELTDTKNKYTIQVLSLSNFKQVRLDAYCKEHGLRTEEVTTRTVNGVVKVLYGKANSLKEAKELIDKLKLTHNIRGVFAVLL